MNFAGNYRHLGTADVSVLRSLVEQLTEAQWQDDAQRQSRYEVHQDTQTIKLVHDPDFRHSKPTRHPMLRLFAPTLQPILAMVARSMTDRRWGRN